MTYDTFDVVVVPFPFTDRSAIKRRPALVGGGTYLADKADAKGVDLSELVNEMLKKEIETIEAVGNKGVMS